jgi:hypothetical protein
MSLRLSLPALTGLLLLAGCVDSTSAVGEQGRIEYTLTTDYDVPQNDLRDARIVTGHEQSLALELTDRGRRDIRQVGSLRHRLSPSLHTRVETEVYGSGEEASALLTVQDPGTYTLESLLDDEVMDSIDLRFDRPARFQVLVRVRGPWEERFDEVSSGGTIGVEEGSQLVLQAVPLDASGHRLAGTLRARLDIEPDWAVTPGVGVIESTELGVFAVKSDLDFYCIEPGPLSFTFEDDVSLARTTQAFQVTAVAH